MSRTKRSRFRREKAEMRSRLAPLPCYKRLHAGMLTIDDCAMIDKTIGVQMGLTDIRDAWFTISVQTCRVLVKDWRHGGAKWLGELLAKSNPEVFKAYKVLRVLNGEKAPHGN